MYTKHKEVWEETVVKLKEEDVTIKTEEIKEIAETGTLEVSFSIDSEEVPWASSLEFLINRQGNRHNVDIVLVGYREEGQEVSLTPYNKYKAFIKI